MLKGHTMILSLALWKLLKSMSLILCHVCWGWGALRLWYLFCCGNSDEDMAVVLGCFPFYISQFYF